MRLIDSGDECPKCGQDQMPRIHVDSQATARACQNCGFVQELYQGHPVSAQVAPLTSSPE